MTRDEYLRQLEEKIANDEIDEDAALAMMLMADNYPEHE